jgi:glycosyltransferase involved in cell wall biosynthesis
VGRPVVTGQDPDCVYATAGWGIHDDRWMAALQSVGFRPRAVSLGRDGDNVTELRAAVATAAEGGLPVIAGPLHSVTRHLVDLPITLVGLSWGYDVDVLASEDATWLAQLDGLVVDSSANAEFARRQGLAGERITFLPWGIDLSQFPMDGPRTPPHDLGLPDDAQLLVSLRAHEPMYRVGDVVEAFIAMAAGTPRAFLVIGHAGTLTFGLAARIEEAGLEGRVRFIGLVPEGELAPLLRGATAYVTASQSDGTSVTLLQAMACGALVIASATPGNLGWIAEGDTGLLFPVGDVAALSACLKRACGHDLALLSETARSTVERDANWFANLPRLREALDAAARS